MLGMALFFILWAFAAIATLLNEGTFLWVMGEFLLCGLIAALFMSFVFLVAGRIKRYDLVDAAWGLVFVVIALASFFMQDGILFEFDVQTLTLFLVALWGLRLSSHIVARIQRTDTEDPRYIEIRKTWKGNLRLNVFVRIYMVQAVLALLICVPVIHINLFSDNGITPLVWVGVAVWVIGYWFEVMADRQLCDFVADPTNQGKLMTGGLWRYSRHPNYFGEITQWWGIFIICLTIPFGWVGIIGPVLISYLILFVSGIPLNEKRSEKRPGWHAYKAQTSALLPLPVRKG